MVRLRYVQGPVRLRIAELGDEAKPLVLLLHGWPEFWRRDHEKEIERCNSYSTILYYTKLY